MQSHPELSKRERQIARELISKGISEDFKRSLLELDSILQRWKDESGNNRECFATLYGEIKDINKMIARRYDHMPGSRYLETLGMQLYHGLFEQAELDAFRPEIKDNILLRVKWIKDFQDLK